MSGERAGRSGPADAGYVVAELTGQHVLRVLSAGATGAILLALSDGPLRTKELTQRVPGYTPRTVSRYAIKLAVHSLTEPCGRELHDLTLAYADAASTWLPNGDFDAHAWSSLGLLADLWESGMIEQLSSGPKSPTDLSKGQHGLSYHQVNRRAGLFAAAGFLHEYVSPGNGRRYSLTDKARRAVALIAAIGRWRGRCAAAGTAGLSPREVGGLLRVTLPLVALPEHAGQSLGFEIPGEDVRHPDGGDVVWATVDSGGRVQTGAAAPAAVDVRAEARATVLVDALLDGHHENGLRVEGDRDLIDTCLERLHLELWGRQPGSPAPAEAVASGGDGS
jgi:DNA-binding HxlR family transcriptional regulator